MVGKKSRKDAHKNTKSTMEEAIDANVGALPSKQQDLSLLPKETTYWPNANSRHLLTCTCCFYTGVIPSPLFHSNNIATSPWQLVDMPIFQFDRFKPWWLEQDCNAGFVLHSQLVLARLCTKVSQAKVYPSIVISPPLSSNQQNQKTHRETSLPKLEDIYKQQR